MKKILFLTVALVFGATLVISGCGDAESAAEVNTNGFPSQISTDAS